MKILLTTLALYFWSTFSFAHMSQPKEVVSIVTWWDYLTKDSLAPIEQSCNVKIYFDEYYSNSEFHRKIDKSDYDIAIYSDNISKDRKLFSTSSIDLKNEFVPLYPKAVRELSKSLDNNSAFFMFALTGLLWNPHNISLKSSNSIQDIFSKAKGKLVLILDEHAAAFDLLKKAGLATENPESLYNIRRLLSGSYVVISSNLGKVHKADNFAFAYVWSGEAYSAISKQGNELQFLLHPGISHIAFDQITVLDDSEATICVVRKLADKSYIKNVSLRTKYLSPYELDKVMQETPFKLREPLKLSSSYFIRSQRIWSSIKMSMNPRIKVSE